MLVIKDLHDALEKLKGTQMPQYGAMMSDGSQETSLLSGILDDRLAQDTHAETALYPNDTNAELRKHKYRRIKYQLVNRLMKLILTVSIPRELYSDHFVNYVAAKKELLVAQILQRIQAHESCRFIAFRVLKKAKKYHLTQEAFQAYEIVLQHYSKHGPRSKFKEFAAQYNEFRLKSNLERDIVFLRSKLRAEFNLKYEIKSDVLEQFQHECDELAVHVAKYPTRAALSGYTTIRSLLYQMAGQYEQALEVMDANYVFLQENAHLSSLDKLASITHSRLRICLKMRDYTRARAYAQTANGLLSAGTFNWFQFQASCMVLNMHTQQWKQAAEIFRRTVTNKSFAKSEPRRELWSVFEAYLRFLAPPDDLIAVPPDLTVHGNTYNISHVLQQLDLARSDKVGLNISVMILQVLQYLQNQQIEMLNGRIESLIAYSYRHLRPNSAPKYRRIKNFISMLAIMQRSEYEAARTVERVRKRYAELNMGHGQAHCNPGDPQIEEIVPYHILWNYIMHELQTLENANVFIRKYKVHKRHSAMLENKNTR